MNKRILQNVSASVHQRLLNIARRTARPFDEVLQYFAMERFLYRLSRSPHVNSFVLKGALLFRVWDMPDSRATRDSIFWPMWTTRRTIWPPLFAMFAP